MNILITGHSRGLGAALSEEFLRTGNAVFGLSRAALQLEDNNLHQVSADAAELDSLELALDQLLPSATQLDLAILNAGVLGPIATVRETSLSELKRVMDINVWANKVLLDGLHRRGQLPTQIVMISSGAGIRGNLGWGAYALSKATLNMLAQLFAQELPGCHVTALAPGLIDTAMQSELRTKDAHQFPSLKRLHDAAGSADMPPPKVVAGRIIACLEQLRAGDSGQFVDLRQR